LSETPEDAPKKKRGRPKVKPTKAKVKPTKAKVKPTKAKKQTSPSQDTSLTVSEAAALVEAQTIATNARLAKAKAAADAAAEEEYKAAAAEAVKADAGDQFTNKRGQEYIFRREMGEPEFWLGRDGLTPPRAILTQGEEAEISRRVLIPANQTPKYTPEHILSPEFSGTSNYERGVIDFKQELEEKIQLLQSDPDSSKQQIKQTQEDLKTLDYLYENFYDGMNVFRTAKGGRSKLQK